MVKTNDTKTKQQKTTKWKGSQKHEKQTRIIIKRKMPVFSFFVATKAEKKKKQSQPGMLQQCILNKGTLLPGAMMLKPKKNILKCNKTKKKTFAGVCFFVFFVFVFKK